MSHIYSEKRNHMQYNDVKNCQHIIDIILKEWIGAITLWTAYGYRSKNRMKKQMKELAKGKAGR